MALANMPDRIQYIDFNFSGLHDLEASLNSLKVSDVPTGTTCDSHITPLKELGRTLQATDVAIENACELGTGYRDLALLTLEPGDYEDVLRHDQDDGLPRTIEILNDELEAVSESRTWENTCIIDAKSYRSNKIRRREFSSEKEAKDEMAYDEMAYDGCEAFIENLQPDVLIVLQSATREANNEFVQKMVSSTSRCGSVFLHRLSSGKPLVVIYSLHPMYAEKYSEGRDPMIRRLRRAMIRFTFLQAMNILSGRMIGGAGVEKLRDAVWAAGQTPHRLLPCGTLNPSLDDRFKGIFLDPNAKPEFKKLWDEGIAKRELEVSMNGTSPKNRT